MIELLLQFFEAFLILNFAGVIRLVNFLSRSTLFGKKKAMKLVVDAGTGTTAVGLALGAICLGWVLIYVIRNYCKASLVIKLCFRFYSIVLFRLPWEVTAIMLADSMDGYHKKEKELISDFKRQFDLPATDNVLKKINARVVQWVERCHPRK